MSILFQTYRGITLLEKMLGIDLTKEVLDFYTVESDITVVDGVKNKVIVLFSKILIQ